MIHNWKINRQYKRYKKFFNRQQLSPISDNVFTESTIKIIEEYFEQQKILNKNKKIRETKIVVLDTETTGLDAQTADILSVGAVQIKNLKIEIQSHHDVILHYGQAISKEAEESISVHGILPQESATGVKEQEYFPRFLELVQNAVIVGHHAAFDIALLSRYIKHLYGFALLNPVVDTHALALRAEHGSQAKDSAQISNKKFTLDALCERYNIEPSDRHTAAGDAYLTALLFLKLVKKIGLEKLKQL